MAETLTEFAARRLDELQTEESHIRRRLQEIQDERKKIEEILNPDPRSKNKTKKRFSKLTIKDMAVDILKGKREGLSATDIRLQINARFERNYSRESLSPQLSRLKQDGILTKDGIVWMLCMEREQ